MYLVEVPGFDPGSTPYNRAMLPLHHTSLVLPNRVERLPSVLQTDVQTTYTTEAFGRPGWLRSSVYPLSEDRSAIELQDTGVDDQICTGNLRLHRASLYC